jgi:histidine triad (HIT) family protein
MPTVFSRIASGEIPAMKLYEDAETFAFMDIAPASKGHALVICKAEYTDLLTIPAETLAAVHGTTQKIALAIQAALKPDGINIVQNNGAAAGQTVFHYHVHIIPRWNSDGVFTLWQPRQADSHELQMLAEQIRTAIDV